MRTERDSLGEMPVPEDARYGAQTARAVANFPISGQPMPRRFIAALGTLKAVAAGVNAELAGLDGEVAEAIARAAVEVERGEHDEHFPVDVFQTGSGTSSNMNANEVIAHRANELLERADAVHPNDHVNRSQSSNDTVPTAVHLAVDTALAEDLLPALAVIVDTFARRADELAAITTGRTHLMDATPITWSQRLGHWSGRVDAAVAELEHAQQRLRTIPQGGTAVGTGINAPQGFAERFAEALAARVGRPYRHAKRPGAIQGSLGAALTCSAALRNLATELMAIASDLRWLNSGPAAGLAEAALPARQPGSSIMPGKVNPVLEEAMIQVCCQVIGFDAACTAAAGSLVNFELAVAQPLAAWNLLEAIWLLTNACRAWLPSLEGFRIDAARCRDLVDRNPILATALALEIGYDAAAAIAKQAAHQGRRVIEVAEETTGLSREHLEQLLDPTRMTRPG